MAQARGLLGVFPVSTAFHVPRLDITQAGEGKPTAVADVRHLLRGRAQKIDEPSDSTHTNCPRHTKHVSRSEAKVPLVTNAHTSYKQNQACAV